MSQPLDPDRRSFLGAATMALAVITPRQLLIGKVTGFGPKMVKADLGTDDKREMQIAIVKVDETRELGW